MIKCLFLCALCIVFFSSVANAEQTTQNVPIEHMLSGTYITPQRQENILRTTPDESAPFVPIIKPAGGAPTVEVLSRQGEWEEVRLHYRFKYNGSTKRGLCLMSLFEGTFTGFRKVSEKPND